MPLTRDSLERQLVDAERLRDNCAQQFKDQGLDEQALKRQPAWRNANAACRQLKRRLAAVQKRQAVGAAADSGESDEG